jgi:hypothetical protein
VFGQKSEERADDITVVHESQRFCVLLRAVSFIVWNTEQVTKHLRQLILIIERYQSNA